MTEGPTSRGGAIPPVLLQDHTPTDFVKSFRTLADQIESGRIVIRGVEVWKDGKGGPDWSVNIELTDTGERG